MTSFTMDGQVEFRFYRAGVQSVKLVGDFNAWSEDDLPMQSTDDGWWTARMRLVAGEYRFRYIADAEWFTDYASHGIELTKRGYNSVLYIPQLTGGASYQDQNINAKQVA